MLLPPWTKCRISFTSLPFDISRSNAPTGRCPHPQANQANGRIASKADSSAAEQGIPACLGKWPRTAHFRRRLRFLTKRNFLFRRRDYHLPRRGLIFLRFIPPPPCRFPTFFPTSGAGNHRTATDYGGLSAVVQRKRSSAFGRNWLLWVCCSREEDVRSGSSSDRSDPNAAILTAAAHHRISETCLSRPEAAQFFAVFLQRVGTVSNAAPTYASTALPLRPVAGIRS